MTNSTDSQGLEGEDAIYKLAEWIVDFEFQSPEGRYMTRGSLITKYAILIIFELTKAKEQARQEAQLELLDRIQAEITDQFFPDDTILANIENRITQERERITKEGK